MSGHDSQPGKTAMEQALANATAKGPQQQRTSGTGKHAAKNRASGQTSPGTFTRTQHQVGASEVRVPNHEQPQRHRYPEVDREINHDNKLIQRQELTERLLPVLQACKRVITIYKQAEDVLEDNNLKEELTRLYTIEQNLSEEFLNGGIMSLEHILHAKTKIKKLALDLDWLTKFADVTPTKKEVDELYKKSLEAVAAFATEGEILGERDLSPHELQPTGHLVSTILPKILRPKPAGMQRALNPHIGDPGTPLKPKKGEVLDADDASRNLDPEIDQDIREHNERLPARERAEAERKAKEVLPVILSNFMNSDEPITEQSIRKYGGKKTVGTDKNGTDIQEYNITKYEAAHFMKILRSNGIVT